MKIGILGAGAAGCCFAGYLKKGGCEDIWLIDMYKEHMDKVAKDGLTFTDHNGTELLTGFHAVTSAEEVGVCDILIILVKSTQTDSAMKGASSCIGENTVVISLQNGLGNDLALQKFLPAGRIGYGCGRIATVLDGPGACTAKPAVGVKNMYIGPSEVSELSEKACKYVVDTFAKGGLEPEYHADLRPYVWKKAASNSGFNTVCAVLGLTMKQVYEDEYGFGLVKGIFQEASDVCAALGVMDNLYDGLVADVPKTVASYANYYPSMAQDVLINQRQTEVDTLPGAIAMYGKQVGIPTPTCDVLSRVIKAVQGNYDLVYYRNQK